MLWKAHSDTTIKTRSVAETRTGKEETSFKNESAQKRNNARKGEGSGLLRYAIARRLARLSPLGELAVKR